MKTSWLLGVREAIEGLICPRYALNPALPLHRPRLASVEGV